MLCIKECIITLVAFVCFFPTVCSQVCPQIACLRRHIVTSGCICFLFLCCAFSSVFSKRSHNKMHGHIGCICLTFLQCVFSNDSSNYLPGRMQSHIGCICLTFHQSVFSYVSSNCSYQTTHSYIDCICVTWFVPLPIVLCLMVASN